ncbi:MAG: 5'-nucleotidase C-terminal domain-containing protein [Bacteroidia bacterium]|nr:5'-nucleotidase C-terminal domain-containing protein [Bacteroidia bacterium]
MKNISRLLIPFGLAMLLLFACNRRSSIHHVYHSHYILSQQNDGTGDSALQHLLRPYKDSLEKSMNQVLVISSAPLTRELPEGSLGNYCADASMRQASKIAAELSLDLPDFCFLNHGGLRAPLPQGPVTVGNVFEVMPFENEMILLHLNGTACDSIARIITRKGGAPVSGLQIQINAGQVESLLIRGEHPQKDKTYCVLTSDYLAGGGDGFDFLRDYPSQKLGIKIRDALILDLRQFGDKTDTLKPYTDGRIIRLQ